MDAEVHTGRLTALDPATVYRILALRSDVFVVEQDCVYLDPDGRDLEAGTVLIWAQNGEDIVATLRLLAETDGTRRIGRVATAKPARGGGLAARLVQRALHLAGDVEVVLEAQSHLAGWYERFGFVRDGADYEEDGIPHTPMRRPTSG